MAKTEKDENDRLREGTLPFDPGDDVVPMLADMRVHKVTLRLASKVSERELPPPSDVHAEAALLAALLWHGAYAPGVMTLDTVHDVLDAPALFYSPAHRMIYEAIEALHKIGVPPDPVLVHAELTRRYIAKAAGGIEYLEQLVASVQVTTDVKLRAYAQVIRDAWTRRRLLTLAASIDGEARLGAMSAVEMAEAAHTEIAKVVEDAAVTGDIVQIGVGISKTLRALVRGGLTSIRTGFLDVDEVTAGLFRKETTILGARTSVGKSTLAAQIALNVAEDPAQGVLYVTLEMPADTFSARLIASIARVDFGLIRRGTVTAEETSRILDAGKAIGERHVHFAASRRQTIVSIHAMAHKLASVLRRSGVRLALLVIDHVGLIKSGPALTRANREQQVADASRGLAWLADEFDCHVIALAQIKRDYAQGKGGNALPQMCDLRESGALEQDADNVWILHREFDEKGMPLDKPASLSIAKQRNDRKAFVKLGCELQFVRFYDWTEGDHA